MSKGKGKAIDYLFEDPEIPSQKYALVSIVGPHMPQKCDVWGLKVRGTADSLEQAKALCKRLLRIDNNYDIYTVDVGKFFPLTVDPLQVSEVEYQNDQLNGLIKSYLENRQNANDFWSQRKNEMIEEAIKEGKNQEEFANKPEHPISVLQRIRTYEESIQETERSLQSLREELQNARSKFDTYTEEEREIALKEFKTSLENNTNPNVVDESDKPLSVEDIRKELEMEMKMVSESSEDKDLQKILEKIKSYEDELQELNTFRGTLSQTAAPKGYDTIVKRIETITSELSVLKTKLNNKDLVNNYINENYPNPKYHFD
jgi:hypothetical protein